MLAVAVSASSKDDLLKDEKHFYDQSQKTYQGGSKAGSAWNMEVVGHNNLGVRGFNGDVWKHEDYAYVGHWGFADWATGNNRFCPTAPDNGVAVIDVSDPADPTRVATLQNPAGHVGRGRRRLHGRRTARSLATTSRSAGSSGAAGHGTIPTRSTG